MADEPEPAKAELVWPLVIELKHPVEFDDEKITKLTFRRGRMGDLKGLKPDEVPSFDQILMLGSRMCGQPVKLLERLSAEDGAEVNEIALGFFAKSLPGGGTPSR